MDEHRDLATKRGSQFSLPIRHLQQRCPCRSRPPRQMRVGNFHEPPSGVDDAKIPARGQATALQRNGDTIPLLRLRNLDDDRRNAKTLQTTQRRMLSQPSVCIHGHL